MSVGTYLAKMAFDKESKSLLRALRNEELRERFRKETHRMSKSDFKKTGRGKMG
jgi:hypothetical protein